MPSMEGTEQRYKEISLIFKSKVILQSNNVTVPSLSRCSEDWESSSKYLGGVALHTTQITAVSVSQNYKCSVSVKG